MPKGGTVNYRFTFHSVLTTEREEFYPIDKQADLFYKLQDLIFEYKLVTGQDGKKYPEGRPTVTFFTGDEEAKGINYLYTIFICLVAGTSIQYPRKNRHAVQLDAPPVIQEIAVAIQKALNQPELPQHTHVTFYPDGRGLKGHKVFEENLFTKY